MEAPQIVMIALWTLNVGITLAKHGEPETGTHNVFTSLIAVGICSSILYWGGFFSGQ